MQVYKLAFYVFWNYLTVSGESFDPFGNLRDQGKRVKEYKSILNVEYYFNERTHVNLTKHFWYNIQNLHHDDLAHQYDQVIFFGYEIRSIALSSIVCMLL